MARRPGGNRRQDEAFPLWAIAAGVVAIIAMAAFVILIFVSGSNGEEDDDVVAVETTPTEEALTPDPDNDDGVDATPEPDEAVDEPEETATPTEDEDDSSQDEEPGETLTPEPSPEASPTPTPTPTPEPLTGDFGELPAADMPSGSPADAMNLTFNLDMSLQSVPSQAPVYQMQRRTWTADSAQQLATSLGIEADVIDQGNNSFRVEDETASVYVTSTLVQYIRTVSPEDEIPALPANDTLQQAARRWLLDHHLVGADIGPADVVHRDEDSGIAYVLVKPVEPPNIIAATPSAGISVRSDGAVVEAMIHWPQSLRSSTYGLRSAESLWEDARRGQQFVDINLAELPADFHGRSGTVTVTSASIAYTVAGSAVGEQFLVPVVVFAGNASIEGMSAPVPVQIYVQAVGAQAAPRG
jgi:hypothetical protein